MEIRGTFKFKEKYPGKGKNYWKCVDPEEGVNFKVSLPDALPDPPAERAVTVVMVGALNTAGKYGTVLEISKLTVDGATK